MRRTVLSVLVVLMALALVASVACSSKSTESPEPELEREGFYRNTTHGFSISYPEDWIREEAGQGGLHVIIRNPDSSGVVQVLMEFLPEIMTSEEYAASAIEMLKEKLSDFEMLSEGSVELGDRVGYEQVFVGSEFGNLLKAKIVSVVRGGQAFAVLAMSPGVFFESFKDTFDDILYSFRLEEPRQPDVSPDDSLTLFDVGPTTLDPALMRDATSASYVVEIFSGLVTLNQDLQVVPDIAEKWEISEDGKTYTFYLRHDVKFHNGEKVTANDFKYSLERACDPATESKTAASYLGDIVGVKERLSGEAEEVSGVEVKDDYILQISIDAPKAYFLAKLVHPSAFVVDQDNVESGDEWWREPKGTGPFKLEEWEEDEILILERSDLYYGQVPGVENVVFRLWGGIPMIMYETGEVDITSVSTSDIERVLDPANPLNKELITIPEFSLWYLGFNVASPPFDDAMVRQAFCHAVDKDKIIELVLKNMLERADGILPPGMPGYNENLDGLEFDPIKAKELIRQSKYGSVDNLPMIVFTTSGRGEVSAINEAIIDMWRQNLGVEVGIRQLEPETYPYVLKEEKDEIFDMGWVADYPDPQNFLDILFHTESEDNTGEYSNPEVDTLLEEAREEMDNASRMRMYQEIEQMLVDDAACLPLFFSVNRVLVKPHVKGFVAAPMPIPWLKYIYIEKEE